tara:strand:- start:17171 stop:17650 length:480 start_codon:yes stop_codon:yes gene_type:complete
MRNIQTENDVLNLLVGRLGYAKRLHIIDRLPNECREMEKLSGILGPITGKPQQKRPLPEDKPRISDRSALYWIADRGPMSLHEQIVHLLYLIGTNASLATAAVTGSTWLSTESYRKPASIRRVPPALIRDLELYIFQRLAEFARVADYRLNIVKEKAAV